MNLNIKELSVGLKFQTNEHLFFFFNASAKLTDIRHHFQNQSFHRLHQRHTDICQNSSLETEVQDPTQGFSGVIGDALYARDAGHAVAVSTADCIPLLIASSAETMAIHAGWKGVENEIIIKSLKNRWQSPEKSLVLIGPHIQGSSFEVDLELAEKFKALYLKYCRKLSCAAQVDDVFALSPTKNDKAFISLSKIALLQLRLCGFLPSQVWTSEVDTKTNLSWASYRREGANMGKNLSFVARRDRELQLA